jgi:hypothetical protein
VQENDEIILTQEGKSGNPATLSARCGLASLPGAEAQGFTLDLINPRFLENDILMSIYGFGVHIYSSIY